MPIINIRNWRVYGLTDSFEFAQKLVQAGVKVLQYRDKTINDNLFVKTAKKIKAKCLENNVLFIINDRYLLNKKIEANGVHIGLNDDPMEKVRKYLGENLIIGLSVKTANQAAEAVKKGVDYVSVSPVFDTVNKKEEPGMGLEVLKQIKQVAEVPIVAIGGINERNLPQVVQAGADSAAFIGELVQAENLQQKVNNLKMLFNKK